MMMKKQTKNPKSQIDHNKADKHKVNGQRMRRSKEKGENQGIVAALSSAVSASSGTVIEITFVIPLISSPLDF
jgi:hypothetical protein